MSETVLHVTVPTSKGNQTGGLRIKMACFQLPLMTAQVTRGTMTTLSFLNIRNLGARRALAARSITDFNSGMPAFEGVIPDQAIWEILAYIKSTWPEQVQKVQVNRNPSH